MKGSFEELINVLKKSMEKDPWLKEQTIEKYKKEIIDEANEIVAAIDKKDFENLKEELGDLFWDVLVLCFIAEKKGLFKAKDVINDIKEKMVRRRPFVFGNEKVSSTKEAVEVWNKVKDKEKNAK